MAIAEVLRTESIAEALRTDATDGERKKNECEGKAHHAGGPPSAALSVRRSIVLMVRQTGRRDQALREAAGAVCRT